MENTELTQDLKIDVITMIRQFNRKRSDMNLYKFQKTVNTLEKMRGQRLTDEVTFANLKSKYHLMISLSGISTDDAIAFDGGYPQA